MTSTLTMKDRVNEELTEELIEELRLAEATPQLCDSNHCTVIRFVLGGRFKESELFSE